MKPSNLIVWLLVAACIAIDLAMIGELQVRRNEWPEAGGVIGLGLSFSQVALISLWAIWGRSTVPFRAVGTLLSVWGVSCLASYSSVGGLGGVGPWFGLLLVYCGASLVPFIIARFAGHTLSNQEAEQPPTTDSRSSSNQFTIWWLVSVMTAVGITLAVIRFAEFPIPELLGLAVFLAILAATACSVLLLSCFLVRVSAAIIPTMVILPITGFLLSHADLAPDEGTTEMVLMTSTQGVTILVAAFVLRAAGYRLVRHTAQRETRASGSSEASELVSADQRDEL